MKFFHVLTLSAAMAAPLAPMAFAAETPVESVVVETDMTAITNEKATAYWGNVSDDLRAAIMTRVQDRATDGTEGLRVSVDIDELSLANSFESAMALDTSLLVGRVRISEVTKGGDAQNETFTDLDTYDLAVSINSVLPYLPEGTQLSPDTFMNSPEHYTAMVDAFAEGVVERLN